MLLTVKYLKKTMLVDLGYNPLNNEYLWMKIFQFWKQLKTNNIGIF